MSTSNRASTVTGTHSHHWPWRSWRITDRAAVWLNRLGATAGYVVANGSGCTACLDRVIWRGRRTHILGVDRSHWRCLLRGHHWPGEPIGMGLCGKCAPCPGCRSQRIDCEPGCPESADGAAVTM